VRPQQGAVPGHRRSPVMTYYDGVSHAERIHQTDNVTNKVQDVIRLDLRRRLGLPIAALVRSHHAKTRFGQRVNLVTPRIPGFGESMTHHYHWTDASLGVVQLYAIALNKLVRDLGHRNLPS